MATMDENYSLFPNTTAQNFTENCTIKTGISLLKVINMAVLMAVVLFGLVGNFLVVLLVYKNQHMRKSMNILISNLAISDSFVLIDDFFTALLESGIVKLDSKELVCKVFYFVYDTGPMVSLCTLLIISITRFRAVNTPIRVSPLSSKKLTLLIAGVWGVPLSIYGYDLVIVTQSKPYEIMICDYIENTFNFYYFTVQASLPLLIFLLIIIINVLILRKLRQKRLAFQLPPSQRKARDLRIRSAVRMVLCSLFLYIILWTPLNILYTLSSISINIFQRLQSDCFQQIRLIGFICITLHATNSAISPVVYAVFIEDFRGALKNLFGSSVSGVTGSTGSTDLVELNSVQPQNVQHTIDDGGVKKSMSK